MKLLLEIASELSAGDARRLFSLLDTKDPYLRLAILELARVMHYWLSSDHISQIIEMIPIDKDSAWLRSGETLRVTLAILAHVRDRLTPKHVYRILDNLAAIEYDVGYNSMLVDIVGAPPGQGSVSPLPQDLTQEQLLNICRLLTPSSSVKCKVGIDLLCANANSVSTYAIDRIMALLPSPNADVQTQVLDALVYLRQRLTAAHVSQFIQYLSCPGILDKHAAAGFLVRIGDSLRPEHILALRSLLEADDIDIAENALEVLAEAPHDLTYESLSYIIAFFKRAGDRLLQIWHKLGAFKEYLAPEHVRQAAMLLNDQRSTVRVNAIHFLNAIGYRDVSVVEQILTHIVDPEASVREQVREYLSQDQTSLTARHVDVTVSTFLAYPEDKMLARVICGFPPAYLEDRIPQFVQLLRHRQSDVKENTLSILGCVTRDLSIGDIRKIESLLESRSTSLQMAAYTCLNSLHNKGLL